MDANPTRMIATLRGIKKEHPLSYAQRQVIAWCIAKLLREENEQSIR